MATFTFTSVDCNCSFRMILRQSIVFGITTLENIVFYIVPVKAKVKVYFETIACLN
jgi:hypothetical protein